MLRTKRSDKLNESGGMSVDSLLSGQYTCLAGALTSIPVLFRIVVSCREPWGSRSGVGLFKGPGVFEVGMFKERLDVISL